MESARPRATRIQIQHTRLKTLGGLVRVAANDGIEPRRLGVKVELLEIVEQIKTAAGGFNNRGKRKLLCPGLRIHIPPNGKDRCNEFELRENFGRANVSGVNDQLHTKQSALGFGTKEAVGIGNDADPHGGRKRV